MADEAKKSGIDADKVAQTAVQLLSGLKTLANVKGISRAELEAIYKIGYGFYNTGKADDAEKIFYFLCLFDHTNAKYWTALGAVRQMKKKFDEAVKAYAAAALFDLHLPKPHYHSAECALAQGDLDAAESGCRTLLHYCPADVGQNNEYRAKAEKLLKVVAELRKNAQNKE